jgi:hypothetical protein
MRSRKARRFRIAGLITGVVLALAAGALVLWSPFAKGPEPVSAVPVEWARPLVSEDALAQRIGVKITQVAVTGGGGLVDLRYQVVDPEAAVAVHDPVHPPAIVDEQSGLVVHDLYMGHSHTGAFKAGVTYYFVFSDPVNWVHRGGQVTVLLGNAQVEHVVVR